MKVHIVERKYSTYSTREFSYSSLSNSHLINNKGIPCAWKRNDYNGFMQVFYQRGGVVSGHDKKVLLWVINDPKRTALGNFIIKRFSGYDYKYRKFTPLNHWFDARRYKIHFS